MIRVKSVRTKKRSTLEDGDAPVQSTSWSLNAPASQEPSETKSSRAPIRPVPPERKSCSSVHKASSKKSKRNRTFAEGWKVTEDSLTLVGSSGDDSVEHQPRGNPVSSKITSADRKTHTKASILPIVELDEDIFEEHEIESTNLSSSKNDDLNTSDESLFVSFVVDSPVKDGKPEDKLNLKDTLNSEGQASFKSILLTSDESSADKTIENVPSKLTTEKMSSKSDERSTFELTETVNDVSTLPLIDTQLETNHTSQPGDFNATSIIEISSGTFSKLTDNSRKISNRRITFKTDDLSTSSSGRNSEMKRRISYNRSPHSKKLNQQHKLDESSNLIDSTDFDNTSVHNPGEGVIDLTTPAKKSNTTSVIKTSKRKKWNLSSSSIKQSADRGEPQKACTGESGAAVLKPLFASTPFYAHVKKSSPEKKTLLKHGGSVLKKISPKKKFSLHRAGGDTIKRTSPKKKSPLKKIERRVIQKTKMPNFKAIHQNALTKMENIIDMTERKAIRAKLLLSGCKPESSTSIKKPEGKSRKALDYVEASDDASTAVVLKPSPNNKKVRSSIPRQGTPIALSKPILRRVEHQVKAQSKIPQVNKPQKNRVEIEKQVKSIATKSKAAHNGLEQRRNAIGNVRMNRRFELLMKMRMK